MAIDEDGVTCIASGITESYRLKSPEIENFITDYSDTSGLEGTITEAVSLAYADHKEQGDEQTFVQIFTGHITTEDLASVKALVKVIAEEVKDSKSFKIQFLGLEEAWGDTVEALIALDDNLIFEGVTHDIVDYAPLIQFSTLEEAINHSLND